VDSPHPTLRLLTDLLEMALLIEHADTLNGASVIYVPGARRRNIQMLRLVTRANIIAFCPKLGVGDNMMRVEKGVDIIEGLISP
jgi:hypothetical protein